MDLTNPESIQHYFINHPPQTEERKQQHAAINTSAFEFAGTVLPLIKNPQARYHIFTLIQQARMVCNQEVTVQELEALKSPDEIIDDDNDADIDELLSIIFPQG